MNRQQYDVLIIGGGHNGLVVAAYLAKAGLRPLVLEKRPKVGGLAVTEEIAPRYWADSVWVDAGTFRPTIIRDLFLKMQGLELIPPDPVICALQPAGNALTFWRNPMQTANSLQPISAIDASHFPEYAAKIELFAGFLERVLGQVAPNVATLTDNDLLGWLATGAAFRALGDMGMYDFLRALPMATSEFMEMHFENEAVRGALGYAGTIATHYGPYAAGTNLISLYHHLGHRAGGVPATMQVRGGIGQLANTLVTMIKYAGGEVRTSAEVAQIILQNGRTTGVAMTNGDTFMAPLVISTANPRHTFFDLVDPYELDPSFIRGVEQIKFRGATARLNLALDGLPSFAGVEQTNWLKGRILIASSLAYLEQAADAGKYGQFASHPALEIRIPTLNDPDLAPPGHHIMTIWAQSAPYHLQGMDWNAQRDRLTQTILQTVCSYVPNLPDHILHQQLLTPADLEQLYGAPEGNLYHGELALDQLLLMRPVAGWGQYRTPIAGLYFAGSGAHPGGGVTGMPAQLAAQLILAERKGSAAL